MKRFCLITIALLSGMIASAAVSMRLEFQPVPTDILPTNSVRMLFCDSDGYIWIPTYSGLVRYDGYESVTYGMDGSDNVTFDCYLNVVAESSDKKIWIASEKGVFTLDKMTGMIEFAGPDLPIPLNASDIVCENGTDIWVGGASGVYHCNAADGIFTEITCEGSPIVGVSSLFEDSEGYLWIAACEHGLYRYDIKTGAMVFYRQGSLYYANTVFKDISGTLWIGTWGKGLLRISDPYSHGELEYACYTHSSDPSSLMDDVVYDINEDLSGRLWIASRSGLSILSDPQQGTSFENYAPGQTDSGIPYNEVSSIIRTKNGKMWLSMYCGGVCKVQTPEPYCRVNYLDGLRKHLKTSSVRSMYQAAENKFWLGIIGYGMVLYDIENDTFALYGDLPEFKYFPYTSVIEVMMRRRTTGEICFGTYSKGLWLLDTATGQAHRIVSSSYPEFASSGITALSEDQDGNMWIGTRTGLYVMNRADSISRPGDIQPFPDAGVLSDVKITDVKVDRQGNVWVATMYEGVYRIVPSAREVSRWMVGDNSDVGNISTVFIDSAGIVWVGTLWNGLSWFDTKSGRFRSVSSLSAISRKGITNIAQDRDSRIWVTTSNVAVSFRMSPDGTISDVSYLSLDEIDTSLSFNERTVLPCPDGSVKVGLSKGVVTFPPSGSEVNDNASGKLCLTDFKVDNQSVRFLPSRERRRISSQDINYISSLNVPHGYKSFSIGFSMLNYAGKNGNIYTYRLEGYDDREMITVDGRHSADYHGVPPGKYRFVVKAMASGAQGSAMERSIDIIVKHSPLVSWWAVLIYVLVALALICLGLKYMQDRLKSREAVRISRIEKQKAEELNHLKLHFFTNVTHELMTPLSIIMASIDSLSRGEDVTSISKVLSTNATRLMRLIQQVLEFRKVESGNLKLSVSEGNITNLVKSCVEAFSPLISGKSQRLSFTSSSERIEGWFDSDKLDKIVYNLLSNASKYTPSGGDISVRLSVSEDGMLILEVANTGELMSEKTIKGLFKRFYEGDYRKHNTIGTGIGLSLVKDLVSLHKGSISVTSTEETGNLFTVRMPINVDAFDSSEVNAASLSSTDPVCPMPASSESSELTRPEGLSRDYTILFVDDNEELCLLFCDLLSRYFNVLSADDGEKALGILAREPVDLIVTDIMMPVMDGIQLCRTVKEKFEYCHIPVILLTAKSTEDNQIEGYDSGADGYVCKPCNFSLLLSQIVNCLKRVERKGADYRRQLVLDVGKLEYTEMDKVFITRAVDCVNAHFSDCDFDLSAFVTAMGTSRTVLTEKLKSLTGMTPWAFILDVRLTVACKHMTENKDNIRINELAFSVGFNDPKYFSTCFKKKYGMTPKDFLKSLS